MLCGSFLPAQLFSGQGGDCYRFALLKNKRNIKHNFSFLLTVQSIYPKRIKRFFNFNRPKRERSFASVQLSFAVITEIFDMANYPYVLEKILQTDLSQAENRAAVQENTRIYLLEWIRTALACSL